MEKNLSFLEIFLNFSGGKSEFFGNDFNMIHSIWNYQKNMTFFVVFWRLLFISWLVLMINNNFNLQTNWKLKIIILNKHAITFIGRYRIVFFITKNDSFLVRYWNAIIERKNSFSFLYLFIFFANKTIINFKEPLTLEIFLRTCDQSIKYLAFLHWLTCLV